MFQVSDKVTHNTYGGRGIVIQSDSIGVKVRWLCVDGPPHITQHYHTELRANG